MERKRDKTGQSIKDPTTSVPLSEMDDAFSDDPRVLKIAQEFLNELESGRKPDRRQWLNQHADLAALLGPCLESLELIYRVAPRAGQVTELSPMKATLRASAVSAEGLPADPLGDFQIVSEIGRGGMGIVYEAIQLSLGRRVALKVLPFAATFDHKQLQRFRQEAQAAAHLHHANIVPVYGVGCERGIHFYAMQLIEGQSLDAVIRQLRKEAGIVPKDDAFIASKASEVGNVPDAFGAVDRTQSWEASQGIDRMSAKEVPEVDHLAETTPQRLSAHFSTLNNAKTMDRFRSIAQCMVQAAQALEYAHQQGIVHRDIKPANLLLDGHRNLWVTDFGLAHFSDTTGVTQTGDVVGTLRYMSPEQASGQRVVLDHRTDIYSLGATFYELLTLREVFPGKTRQILLQDVLNRDPRPPRSLHSKIPIELETILLKSLSKNPADRYTSAQHLADDLNRFLRDEPIRAKRPSFLEHARKWSRRHPTLVGAGMLVMFLALVGSLATNWLINRANKRTNAALAEAQVRAEEAQRRFQQARKAADLLVEVSEQESGSRPPEAGMRRRLLETAIDYYKDFINSHSGDATGQAELIAVRDRLKKLLDDLALLEGAGQYIVLTDKQVQDDLALNDSQRQQIAAMYESLSQRRLDALHDFSQLSSLDRQARSVELARASDRAMRNTLSAEQLLRLEQITLQVRGPLVFTQPDVIARLHLTEAQRHTIRQIEFETMAANWEHMGGKVATANGSDAMAIVFREVIEKIVALLTPEQAQEWKKMTGRPVHDDHGFLPPGPIFEP